MTREEAIEEAELYCLDEDIIIQMIDEEGMNPEDAFHVLYAQYLTLIGR